MPEEIVESDLLKLLQCVTPPKGGIGGLEMIDNIPINSDGDSNIYFSAEIDPISMLKFQNVLKDLFKKHLEIAATKNRDPEPINLFINSYGGELYSAMHGYDFIREINYHVPVYTHITGIAASAATLLSIAGCYRTITPSSEILIHEIRTFAGFQTYSEFYEEFNNLKKIEDLLVKRYLTHSNFKEKELREFLKHKNYSFFIQKSWL